MIQISSLICKFVGWNILHIVHVDYCQLQHAGTQFQLCSRAHEIEILKSSVGSLCRNYLCTEWTDFFKILVLARLVPYAIWISEEESLLRKFLIHHHTIWENQIPQMSGKWLIVDRNGVKFGTRGNIYIEGDFDGVTLKVIWGHNMHLHFCPNLRFPKHHYSYKSQRTSPGIPFNIPHKTTTWGLLWNFEFPMFGNLRHFAVL